LVLVIVYCSGIIVRGSVLFNVHCLFLSHCMALAAAVAVAVAAAVAVAVAVVWGTCSGLGVYLHVSPPLRQPLLLRPSFAIRHTTWQQWPKSNSQDRMNLGR